MTYPRLPSSFARAAFVLACLAVAVRVWIPQGFMAAPAEARGLSPIVLCSGQGPVTRFIDDAGRLVDAAPQPRNHSGKSPHGSACVFSGTATGLAPSTAATIAAGIVDFQIAATPLPPGLAPGQGLCAPPPPPTGPPLTT